MCNCLTCTATAAVLERVETKVDKIVENQEDQSKRIGMTEKAIAVLQYGLGVITAIGAFAASKLFDWSSKLP